MRKTIMAILLSSLLAACGGPKRGPLVDFSPSPTATPNVPAGCHVEYPWHVVCPTATITPTPSNTPIPPPDVYIGAILGLDSDPAYPERNQYGVRSDVIDIIRVTVPKTNDPMTIQIISVPRDLWIKVPCSPLDPSLNGYDRANAAWAYGGPDCFKSMVAENMPFQINGPVVALEFDQFLKLVDTMGGLDIVPTKTYTDWCGSYHGTDGAVGGYKTWTEGRTYHMQANELLCYARGRHGAPDGDLDRNRRAIEIVKAIIAQWPSQFFSHGDALSTLSANWGFFTRSMKISGLSLSGALDYIPLLGKLPDARIEGISMTLKETRFWRTPIYNASVLLPTVNVHDWLACEIAFGDTQTCTGMFQETPVQLVTPEATP